MRALITLLLLLTSACGYRFQDCPEDTVLDSRAATISIPSIPGDGEGLLNTSLIRAIAASSQLDYRKNDGSLTLDVTVVSDTANKIGYRYDRDPKTGKLKSNILGTENRRTITVEVKLTDFYTEQVLVGPVKISVNGDYDYLETSSIRDLVFFDPHGAPQTVLDFSLGQLDSIEGASDDVRVPIYQRLAEQIVSGICNQTWEPTPSSQ